jgi:putative chitinase
MFLFPYLLVEENTNQQKQKSMIITVDMLKGIAPGSKQTDYKLLPGLAAEMNAQFPGAGIDTIQEVRHFLAQAACETDSFNSLVEYASGKEYEGRKDLGNISPGDGIKYKGRGIFQITGYINYVHLRAMNKDNADFVRYPDLLAQPKYAVWSALLYWNDRHLSDIANMQDDHLVFSKTLNKQLTPIQYITYRINGGQNGIYLREHFYERAKEIIS